MNILLIEPDRVMADIYGQALRDAEHNVVYVHGAQRAIHQCDTNQPDVIVMELQLPQHNGIEFLYELRSYPEWQHIPVILHTVVPSEELLSPILGRQLNITNYCYKPQTSLAQLTQVVAESQLYTLV